MEETSRTELFQGFRNTLQQAQLSLAEIFDSVPDIRDTESVLEELARAKDLENTLGDAEYALEEANASIINHLETIQYVMRSLERRVEQLEARKAEPFPVGHLDDLRRRIGGIIVEVEEICEKADSISNPDPLEDSVEELEDQVQEALDVADSASNWT